ncbi:ATP-binding protein [Streptomyces sp. NPDC007107]|uniref:ATP-binding protein n=1 Tax=Streptomyces sp. NPDC007107 TaxID=3156915 RepID=UPI0033F95567
MTSSPTASHKSAPPHTGHEFVMRFTSTPRGARLARLLVGERLDAWGIPYRSPAHDTLSLITGELSANAVQHGHVPGRDFRVRLTVTADVLRIEVTDTRTERRPADTPRPTTPPPDSETGRGLLLVEHLAIRWGVMPRAGAPGKTVWAELCVSPESTASRPAAYR